MRDIIAQFQREQLHQAAQHGDLPGVRRLLLAGYPVNRFDELGRTPLHYAFDERHLAVVETLLQAGADVNAHCERLIGNTPLGGCAGTCSYEMAKTLINAGADPTIPGWMGLNAIDRARDPKRKQAKRVIRLLEAAAHKP